VSQQDAVDLVRRLLAKAESTSFPAESDAFRAKAVQLMARHGITEAMLNPQPEPMRVVVMHPPAWMQAQLIWMFTNARYNTGHTGNTGFTFNVTVN
jgi:hypothetical protein